MSSWSRSSAEIPRWGKYHRDSSEARLSARMAAYPRCGPARRHRPGNCGAPHPKTCAAVSAALCQIIPTTSDEFSTARRRGPTPARVRRGEPPTTDSRHPAARDPAAMDHLWPSRQRPPWCVALHPAECSPPIVGMVWLGAATCAGGSQGSRLGGSERPRSVVACTGSSPAVPYRLPAFSCAGVAGSATRRARTRSSVPSYRAWLPCAHLTEMESRRRFAAPGRRRGRPGLPPSPIESPGTPP